jgi:hypothetical protein
LKSDIGCWVVVVAEGINPMDLEEVIHAIRTRSNPEKGLDILRQTWSGLLDPLIFPEDKKRREYFSSKGSLMPAGLSPGAMSSPKCASRARH